ncbi:hypothetical protein POTOM_024349 [Populus tomentosa]|uniref:Uncharacterized protein n=1 Tax=Populus tomentosa TaxID=118781 RepID=A0A8X7ZN55_POPTO|nr:hypothetical protein POTOM_024349 [Populus tomentosa]
MDNQTRPKSRGSRRISTSELHRRAFRSNELVDRLLPPPPPPPAPAPPPPPPPPRSSPPPPRRAPLAKHASPSPPRRAPLARHASPPRFLAAEFPPPPRRAPLAKHASPPRRAPLAKHASPSPPRRAPLARHASPPRFLAAELPPPPRRAPLAKHASPPRRAPVAKKASPSPPRRASRRAPVAVAKKASPSPPRRAPVAKKASPSPPRRAPRRAPVAVAKKASPSPPRRAPVAKKASPSPPRRAPRRATVAVAKKASPSPPRRAPLAKHASHPRFLAAELPPPPDSEIVEAGNGSEVKVEPNLGPHKSSKREAPPRQISSPGDLYVTLDESGLEAQNPSKVKDESISQRQNQINEETIEWLLLIINVLLEAMAAVFDQVGHALTGMVIAFLALFVSTFDLICKAWKEGVQSSQPFGGLLECYGLAAAVWQCFYSTMGYWTVKCAMPAVGGDSDASKLGSKQIFIVKLLYA